MTSLRSQTVLVTIPEDGEPMDLVENEVEVPSVKQYPIQPVNQPRYLFNLPVDSENKATIFRVLSLARPHMLSFHLSWINFFMSFVSTFAPVALIPVIRDVVQLTDRDIGMANVAAVSGSVFARVIMGSVCDTFGPRYGHSVLTILTAPFVVSMAVVQSPTAFITLRLFIGFSLATFVANQYWSTVMFNVKIVGMVNATGAGWGNLGGGVTQLLMPVVFQGLSLFMEHNIAWRVAFFIPYFLHLIVGMSVIIFGQDLPEGDFYELKKKGFKLVSSGYFSLPRALYNYRTYCMVIIYGLSFGVELTMSNIITPYLFDQFDLELTQAGTLGACFGLMNLFARSVGGVLSDYFANKIGMRGRLWVLYVTQTLEGIFCVIMGYMQNSLGGTMALLVLFSLFVQASEGAAYSVVPFISQRSLGAVSGVVSAGGNAGSAILQLLLFQDDKFETYESLRIMGCAVVVGTLFVIPVYFPMWGSMFISRIAGVTEEQYYLQEYSEMEKQQGLNQMTLKFACESRSQRVDYSLRN